MMGSNDGDYDEKPVHPVNITRPFYMMKIDFKSGVQGAPTAPFQKLGVKLGAMRPWGRHPSSDG